MNLEGLVVVITGASSGVGRATALGFATRDARVVLVARDRDALQEVARECVHLGGEALVAAADVTREDEVRDVVMRTVARFGRIDVWVNNAAVSVMGRFENIPPDVYRRVMETNFFGYVHGARAVLPIFRRQKRGTLINVGSVNGGAAVPFASVYVASKFAVRGWSSALRMELLLDKLDDVHVCYVMPAAIDTPFFQHLANYSGRAVRALDPTYPATKIAEAIMGLAEKPRHEIVVGAAGRAMLAQAAATPRAWERSGAKFYDRDQFYDKRAPQTEGNLFRTAGPKAISGGWQVADGRGRVAAAVAFAALGAFATATLVRRLRREKTAGQPDAG